MIGFPSRYTLKPSMAENHWPCMLHSHNNDNKNMSQTNTMTRQTFLIDSYLLKFCITQLYILIKLLQNYTVIIWPLIYDTVHCILQRDAKLSQMTVWCIHHKQFFLSISVTSTVLYRTFLYLIHWMVIFSPINMVQMRKKRQLCYILKIL